MNSKMNSQSNSELNFSPFRRDSERMAGEGGDKRQDPGAHLHRHHQQPPRQDGQYQRDTGMDGIPRRGCENCLENVKLPYLI